MDLTDEEINQYVNQAFTEEVVQQYENQLLLVMKTRFEKYPTPINDKEWLDYTDFVCRRRCKRGTNEK